MLLSFSWMLFFRSHPISREADSSLVSIFKMVPRSQPSPFCHCYRLCLATSISCLDYCSSHLKDCHFLPPSSSSPLPQEGLLQQLPTSPKLDDTIFLLALTCSAPGLLTLPHHTRYICPKGLCTGSSLCLKSFPPLDIYMASASKSFKSLFKYHFPSCSFLRSTGG